VKGGEKYVESGAKYCGEWRKILLVPMLCVGTDVFRHFVSISEANSHAWYCRLSVPTQSAGTRRYVKCEEYKSEEFIKSMIATLI
jgi:hypothetical protein